MCQKATDGKEGFLHNYLDTDRQLERLQPEEMDVQLAFSKMEAHVHFCENLLRSPCWKKRSAGAGL